MIGIPFKRARTYFVIILKNIIASTMNKNMEEITIKEEINNNQVMTSV